MTIALALDLTLQDIIMNIPHDGPSVIVYGVLAIFGGMIWLGSRKPAPAESRDAE